MVVVGTLGLALAANATIFSLVDAIVLRPYRFDGVDRLILVASDAPTADMLDRESVAPGDFRDWRRDARSVSTLGAFDWWQANLSDPEHPERLPGFRVTSGFFAAIGMAPAVGRTFREEEETIGRHRVVVLGHALWTRRFDADPGVIGRTIRVDDEPFEVVGIAPPGFQIPFGAEIWMPLAFDPQDWEDRRPGYLGVIGRLADRRSLGEARAEFTSLVERQRRLYPETNAAREVVVTDFTAGMDDDGAGPFLATWQAAAALLLLIACANVANLLLARGTERSQEFGVRLALGAGRGRLAWQVFLEGAVLAAFAAALAMPLAWIGLAVSKAALPPSIIRFIPGWEFIRVDVSLLGTTIALGALATIVFSLLPALHATRAGLSDTIRQSGRTLTASGGRQWVRTILAASQVALTLALLFGAGLMLAAADRAVNGALGFDKRQVLTAELTLPEVRYADPDDRRRVVSAVLERMRPIPAVLESAVTSTLPYGPSNPSRQVWPEGQSVEPSDLESADYRRVSPGYFAAMRIALRAGRLFTDQDRLDAPEVAIVSENFAHRYWPGRDPLGRRFKIREDGPWIRVVGVSADVLHNWFQQQRRPTVYRPLEQDPPFQLAFTIRTAGDPLALAGDLGRAVRAVDPTQPIGALRSMDAVVAERTSGLTFIAGALGVLAVIALLLAVAGVYSLMAYAASLRTREIGVRMAFGAGWWQVVRLTTGQALRVTIAGTLVGALMAAWVGQVMQASLAGAVANDLPTLGILVVALIGVALAASYFPARRAANLDPSTALRAD
ncbi:MAG: ABC transporter permease [Acidobacteriota bacterium]